MKPDKPDKEMNRLLAYSGTKAAGFQKIAIAVKNANNEIGQ